MASLIVQGDGKVRLNSGSMLLPRIPEIDVDVTSDVTNIRWAHAIMRWLEDNERETWMRSGGGVAKDLWPWMLLGV